MNSASSNSERCIRVEFPPKERRSWCAGATRPEAEKPGRGGVGWTTFLRMPQALRRRLRKAGQLPSALDVTPAALPAPAADGSGSPENPSEALPACASQEKDAR